MYDVAIIGGGMLGLSLAYEVAQRDLRTLVIDIRQSQTQASWAAGGLLPAVGATAQPDPVERLRALSHVVLRDWAQQLHAETGVDAELERCGAIHLARTHGECAALQAYFEQLQADGVNVERCDHRTLVTVEPALDPVVSSGTIRAAYFVAQDSVIRPPRLLRALKTACRARGVEFLCQRVAQWNLEQKHAIPLLDDGTTVRAARYCICGGAWSGALLRALGVTIEFVPWRGQMLLLKAMSGLLRRVIYEGPNYLIPRRDGQVLVGSTMEDVGFEDQTTREAGESLRFFANSVLPQLAVASQQAQWAGFRPGTADGWPLIGALPWLENVFVAAGHFRNGISLAAGTAVVVSEMMRGQPLSLDVSSFRPNR